MPALLIAGLLPASASEPTTTAEPTTFFGTSVSRTGGESYPQAVARITRNYGAPQVMRVFNTGLPNSWSTINANLGTNAPLVISFKAAPREILSGRLDTFFKNWFAQAPTDRRTFWSYYHEPEDNIARGEFTASDYRAAWHRLADLAATANNQRLKPTLILMTWSVNAASHRNWRDYYAAGAIRILAWDGYNPYERQGRYASPSEMFDRARNAAASVGLRFAIAEFGSQLAAGDSGALRAQWLRASEEYLRQHNARFVTYFDTVFPGENDFRLLDAPSRDAWRSAVSGS